MNTFFLALFQPIKTFGELKTSDKSSAMSLIALLFLMLLNLILMIPVTEKVLQITLSSMPLNPNQTSMTIEIAHKMRYLQIVGVIIMYFVMILFYALVFYLSVYIAKDRLSYKKALQLIVYSYFIVVIGDLANTALLHLRGLDAITNMHDIYITGFNMLTSIEQIGATGYVFLSCINPFQLWFVVLLSIGLRIFTDMKPVKAIIICVMFWLITTLFPVLSVYFSESTFAKAGVM